MIGVMKGKGEDTTAILAEVDGLKGKTAEAEVYNLKKKCMAEVHELKNRMKK
jgi:hypothetical protein